MERQQLAFLSLKGVSVGDAFGESFFGDTDQILQAITEQKIPTTSWEFTDDTIMALAVFEQLEAYGDINQDKLAQTFAIKHDLDPRRGYGATVRTILRDISKGMNWQQASNSVFDGMGSMGNGAAMRSSPIGAYFFDDLDKTQKLAIQSATITHTNIEGICGAIAVATATAIATQLKINNLQINPNDFILQVANYCPSSDTKSKILKSIDVNYNYDIQTVKAILGNGTQILAQDTVPFAVWCAAHNLNSFENALWKAVSILGDRDTICAIVGGIVAMSSLTPIPTDWLNWVEKVEDSLFRNRKA